MSREPVAQPVEHIPFKDGVAGSNPARLTTQMIEEQYFTIKQVAERLGMSLEKIRQLVMHEPGVLRLHGTSGTRFTYRVPVSVLERIIHRSTNPH